MNKWEIYTDYSVVDDGSEGSLVSSQAVQIEGKTLKQSLVTHLEQPGPKRVVWMNKILINMINKNTNKVLQRLFKLQTTLKMKKRG